MVFGLGSKPIPSLLSLPHVHFLYLSQPPKGLTSSLPFILSVPLKIAHQITTVLSALLLRIPNPPEFILVQVSPVPFLLRDNHRSPQIQRTPLASLPLPS